MSCGSSESAKVVNVSAGVRVESPAGVVKDSIDECGDLEYLMILLNRAAAGMESTLLVKFCQFERLAFMTRDLKDFRPAVYIDHK